MIGINDSLDCSACSVEDHRWVMQLRYSWQAQNSLLQLHAAYRKNQSPSICSGNNWLLIIISNIISNYYIYYCYQSKQVAFPTKQSREVD